MYFLLLSTHVPLPHDAARNPTPLTRLGSSRLSQKTTSTPSTPTTNRKKAMVSMEGQFLVRQIYDDEITYNLIGAAVEILSE